MRGKNLAQRTNQEPKPEPIYFLILLLKTKVAGVGMVALDVNFSAWGVSALMPGGSCLTQQESPQWTPRQPSEHTGPDHQHLEGQPHSIFRKDQGNERKT